jgi:anti-sigma regulatory factor (Ser/Thr protein kinase)
MFLIYLQLTTGHRPLTTISMDTPDLPGAVQIEQTHLRLPSRPDWVEATVDFLKRKALLSGACQESRSNKLTIALHEALSNAIIHGNYGLSSELKERGDSSFAEALAARMADPTLAARQVEMLIDYDGQRCRWIITDEGEGFDVQHALDRLSSADPEVILASGRGILIMRSFMDEVRYERGGRRLILSLMRSSGTEKRHHDRHSFQQPLRVVPVREDGSVDWDAAYEAVSRNISREGLTILQEKLATSNRIIIGLPAGNQIVYLPAEIRHCRAVTDEIVEIGCRFQAAEPVLAQDATGAAVAAVHQAVGALLEQLRQAPESLHEKRTHVRLHYHGQVEVRCEGLAPIQGFARDLSKGGIGFLTTVPVPCEERILMLSQATDPPLAVRAKIQRCMKIKDGLYDVGANFVMLEP